jgi:hypothetical protein
MTAATPHLYFIRADDDALVGGHRVDVIASALLRLAIGAVVGG